VLLNDSVFLYFFTLIDDNGELRRTTFCLAAFWHQTAAILTWKSTGVSHTVVNVTIGRFKLSFSASRFCELTRRHVKHIPGHFGRSVSNVSAFHITTQSPVRHLELGLTLWETPISDTFLFPTCFVSPSFWTSPHPLRLPLLSFPISLSSFLSFLSSTRHILYTQSLNISLLPPPSDFERGPPRIGRWPGEFSFARVQTHTHTHTDIHHTHRAHALNDRQRKILPHKWTHQHTRALMHARSLLLEFLSGLEWQAAALQQLIRPRLEIGLCTGHLLRGPWSAIRTELRDRHIHAHGYARDTHFYARTLFSLSPSDAILHYRRIYDSLSPPLYPCPNLSVFFSLSLSLFPVSLTHMSASVTLIVWWQKGK